MDNQTGRVNRKKFVEDDINQLDLPSMPPRTILLNIKNKRAPMRGKSRYYLRISHNGGVSVT